MGQSNILQPKHNYFIKIFLFLLFVVIAMQLYILSSIGTKGEELSYIKNTQSNIKIENEILKARVMALKSNQAVLEGLDDHVEVITKPINFLDPLTNPISAQF